MTYEQVIADRLAKEEASIAELERKIKEFQNELKVRKKSLKNLQNPKFKDTFLTALSIVSELTDEQRAALQACSTIEEPVKKDARIEVKHEVVDASIDEPCEETIVHKQEFQAEIDEPVVEVERQDEVVFEPVVEVERQDEASVEPVVEVECQEDVVVEPIIEAEQQVEVVVEPIVAGENQEDVVDEPEITVEIRQESKDEAEPKQVKVYDVKLVEEEKEEEPKLYGPSLFDEHIWKYPNGRPRKFKIEVHPDGSRCMTVENWDVELPDRFTAEEYLKLIGFKFYPSPAFPAPARKVIDGKTYAMAPVYDTPSLDAQVAYIDDMAMSVQCEHGMDDDFDDWKVRRVSLFTAAIDNPGRTFYKDGDIYRMVPLPKEQIVIVHEDDEPEPPKPEEKKPKRGRGRGKKQKVEESAVDEDSMEPESIPRCTAAESAQSNYDGFSQDYLTPDGYVKPYKIPVTTAEELFDGEEVPEKIPFYSDDDHIYKNDPCFISSKHRDGYNQKSLWIMREVYQSNLGCVPLEHAPAQHCHMLGFFGRNAYVRGVSSEVARIIEYMATEVDVNFNEAMNELEPRMKYWNLHFAQWRLAMHAVQEGTNGALQMEFYIPKPEYREDFVKGWDKMDFEEYWADNEEEFCKFEEVRLRLIKVGRFPKEQENSFNQEVEMRYKKYYPNES